MIISIYNNCKVSHRIFSKGLEIKQCFCKIMKAIFAFEFILRLK